jgi:hypothetical protein
MTMKNTPFLKLAFIIWQRNFLTHIVGQHAKNGYYPQKKRDPALCRARSGNLRE